MSEDQVKTERGKNFTFIEPDSMIDRVCFICMYYNHTQRCCHTKNGTTHDNHSCPSWDGITRIELMYRQLLRYVESLNEQIRSYEFERDYVEVVDIDKL